MLTDKQRELFSEILDINWGVDHAINEKSFDIAFQLTADLEKKQAELRESMGDEKYNDFMNKGKKMFS